MSRPGAEAPKLPEPSADDAMPVGGLDPTLRATGVFEPASGQSLDRPDPTLQATMAFSPAEAPAADDRTVEVTNLAFPRAHVGPEPGATVEAPSSIAPRRPRARSDSDTAPTLDAEGKTNAFSMSSVDGSAEIVLSDLPFVAGYKLYSELGRGGMGVVYKARQEKLDRFVALKMVLAGAHASADQLARFLVEAQAVAALTHNHIVQIFDVGERDNLPFFSLEYIDGGSLQQTINGKPQPVRYAAKTVKTLCEAMAFAHSRGIIHRDLKPANVLMTKAGEPKITDFGLAKRLEGDSQQTRDGAIMGTPSYMAPEQAWGLTSEIGPLADEHALGAILYEMLTGRPPYQGANPLDTLDQVRNQEPVPPSRLQPKVPRDLETICLKAIQKDPHKRYPSCQEMADDLGRYLDEKPILARPVSAVERTWRWCKRNRTVAALSAAAALMVMAGLVGATAFAITLSKKNADLRIANAAEAKAKDEAIVAKDKAIASEKQIRSLAMAGIDLTSTMLESQRYTTILMNSLLRDIPGTLDVRREMFKTALMTMKRAVKDVENLRKRNAGSRATDAMTLRTLANIHQQRAVIHADMGPRYADLVWPDLEEMKKLAEQHYAQDPDDLEAIKNMAASRMTLGDFTFSRKADEAGAEVLFKEAIRFREMWLDKWPADDTAKQALANSLGRLAMLYLDTGHPDKAAPLFEREEKVRLSVGIDKGQDSEFRRETAGMYEKIGDLRIHQGKPEKGLECYEKSYGIRVEVAKDKDHPQAAHDAMLSLRKLGNYYQVNAKDSDRALKYYEQSLVTARDRLKNDPASSFNRRDLALILYFIGTVQLERNDLAASDEAYAESLDICKSLVNPNMPIQNANEANLQAYMQLMLRLARCGQHAEAAKIAEALVKNPPSNGYVMFQAACGYALAAAAVERREPENKALAKTYRDASASALKLAVARGWRSFEEIAHDPDLAPLRADPGFPPLLEELRKAGK